MSSKVSSIGLKGLEGYRVSVEAQAVNGIPSSIVIVGLPDRSVKESKQRIVGAFHSLDYFLHHQKIIINLSPPEQQKNGPLLDLPMAIGILLCLGEINIDIPSTTGFIGALSLDGSIHPVEGMLPAILAAKKAGIQKLYMPHDKSLPFISISDLEIVAVKNLQDVTAHLEGKTAPDLPTYNTETDSLPNYPDFQQIIGHPYEKHALEVAAAGGHHLLMSGPPGCGKSLLAESFPSILPKLTEKSRLEIMSIYQLSDVTNDAPMYPPYRNPHHSSSGISIIGGGQFPKPGEISLAHHGVLFLDEIAEFPKKTLEMLRQPLESGYVTISRARSTVTYPCSFILVGAMNPCPCGYLGSNKHYCTCTLKQISGYQNKLSGPVRDRFDIHLSLRTIDLRLSAPSERESSKIVRQRVHNARSRQYQRYGKEITNGQVPYETLMQKSVLSPRQGQLLQKFSINNGWSNREQIKIIRLAQTIADLKNNPEITEQNIWEAIKLHGWKSVKPVSKRYQENSINY